MPFNPATAVFARVWRFVDRFLPGDDVTRQDLDLMADDLTEGINAALRNNLNFVGDWIAGSAFPTQRPDGSPVRARDTWRVATAGTVGGVSFAEDDYLTALVPSPGALYANNWIKIPSLLIPSVLTLVDEAQDIRDEVSTLFMDFDTRYLGSKTGDPSTDNDGNALIDGALYWNSVLKRLRIYDLDATAWTETSLVGDAYAQKAQNLNDLTSKATAIANLFGTTALTDWEGYIPRVKADASGLEFRSPAEVRSDIGAASTADIASAVPPGTIIHFASMRAPTGYLKANGALVSRVTYANLFEAICPVLGNFTVTIASPGVFTLNDHGLINGDQVRLTTTGALPTGLNTSTTYFVVSAATNTFQLSLTLGGAAINTSGSQSGTHSVRAFPHGAGDGVSTFALPDLRGEFLRGLDDGRGVDSGRVLGSAQSSQNLSHSHSGTTDSAGAHSHTGSTSTDGAHTHTVRGVTIGSQGWTGSSADRTDGTVSTSSAGSHSHSLSINSGGAHSHALSISSSGGAEARPRNIALLACIKT